MSCETLRRDRQDVKVQLVFVIPELKYLGISGIFAKSGNAMSFPMQLSLVAFSARGSCFKAILLKLEITVKHFKSKYA